MTPSRYRRFGIATAYPREKPSPRRAIKLIIVAGVIIIVFIILTSSPVPARVRYFPVFRPTAHQPPVQPNSTSGDAKWYSDWKWHNPFSLSITQDETRSVLPPLMKRPPIYAFYDSDLHKSEAERSAERKLLLIWRRAWWAQGFKPVILGRAEAMKNPLYETLQGKAMGKSLETEFLRWLAWGDMGTGVLANWLVLPMGPYNDTLLTYLRRGDYPRLTKYEGLGVGLFSGEKTSVNAALKEALKSSNLQDYHTIIDAIDPNAVFVDPKPEAIAFYESSSMAEIYNPLIKTLTDDKTAGLRALAQLMTSHLHQTFLESFPSGLTVLNPYERINSLLILPAANIAKTLNTCPPSPMPSSCPPNKQNCIPCSSIPITVPESHTNSSSLFTIGIFPHPYTLASLMARTKDITVRHIRRETDRDPWLFALTKKTLGDKLGGQSRILPFKEVVASDWGAATSLWMTEDWTPTRRDLEWRIGFALPTHNSSTTLTSADQLTASPSSDASASEPEKAARERSTWHQRELITAARVIVKKGGTGSQRGIREAAEAWNLADTEAWRFVRAFGAREAMERKKWEVEERKYAGGKEGEHPNESGGAGWGR